MASSVSNRSFSTPLKTRWRKSNMSPSASWYSSALRLVTTSIMVCLRRFRRGEPSLRDLGLSSPGNEGDRSCPESLQNDLPRMDRDRDGLRPCRRVQLDQGVLHVFVHRLLGNVQDL